jgi:hemolysin III
MHAARTRKSVPPSGVAAAATEPLADEDDHIPLLDDAIDHAAELEKKPSWRGWIHAGTFPLAIAAGIVLIVLSEGAPAKIASAVFMASSLLLFGVSAVYHRFNWKPTTKAVFRRLDHSNIFLLIAGTYTPLAIDALEWPKNVIMLSVIWGGAIIGILSRIFWLKAPRWSYVVLYIALGWAAVIYMGDLFAANPVTMILVIVGGLSYTTGALFYAFKRPNPVPGVFGFHELFHACTVIAFLCHWVGILLIAMNPIAG